MYSHDAGGADGDDLDSGGFASGQNLRLLLLSDAHDQYPFRCRHARNSIDCMDGRQMQRFKTLLEIRQDELRLSIEHQLQYARRAEPEPDTLDQATTGYDKESSLQRSNTEQHLLRMVDSALGRIWDGSFGQCLSCGNEIDGRRLQAVPWTRYCIQCQENFER